MAAKVEIVYEAEAGSLKATINEINKANDAVVEGAQQSSKEIQSAYKNVGKSIASAFSGSEVKKALNDQNKAFDDLNKKSKPLTQVLRGIRNELNALEESGQGGTAAFRQLTLEAARLEDQIGDTRARVSNLASDTFKFDAAVQATQGLAAGFEVAQGAAALFGSENEDLQKVIAQTTAAMAIANGLQQISSLLLEESKLKTLALTTAQAAYNGVIALTSGALKGLRVALAATGVGALLVALGAVIAYWDDIKGAISGVSAEQDALNVATNNNLAAEKSKLEAIDSQDNILKLQGKTEKEILQLKVKQTEQTIIAQEEAIKQAQITLKSQIEAEKRNRNILTGLLSLTTQPLQALINGIDFVAEKVSGNKLIDFNLADKLASFVFDPEAVEAEGKKALEESQKALADLRNQRAGYLLSIQDIDKQAADDAAAKRKDANDKANEAAKKAAEDQLKAREALLAAENEAFLSQLSEQEKIRAEANAKGLEIEKNFRAANFKAGSDEAIKAEREKNAAIEAILADANKRVAELDKRDIEAKLQKDLEAAKAGADATIQQQIAALQEQQRLELEAADALGKNKLDITAKYNKEISDLNNQLSQSEYNTKVSTLKALEIVEGTSLERRIELINIEADRRKKEAEQSIKDEKERAAAIALINAETEAAIRAEREKTRDQQVKDTFEFIEGFANVTKGVIDLQRQQTEETIANLEQQRTKQLEIINSSIELEAEKERQRLALNKKINDEIAKQKRKAAVADKALALFETTINVARGITAALTSTPPNIPLSILVGATGALQIAAIASKPIPKFAQGGLIGGRLHSGGGTLIEAERDEYIVNRGQSLRHRGELDAINKSSAAFKKLIDERYVRPALLAYASDPKNKAVIVKASLNSKTMEKHLKNVYSEQRKSNKILIGQKQTANNWRSIW